MTSIITEIFDGVRTEWKQIAGEIEAGFAKIKSTLPASAQGNLVAAEAVLKQAASDALSSAVNKLAGYEPGFVKALEAQADAALAALTGGLSVPFTPLLNNGIEDVVAQGTAALQAWALKQKVAAISPSAAGTNATALGASTTIVLPKPPQ